MKMSEVESNGIKLLTKEEAFKARKEGECVYRAFVEDEHREGFFCSTPEQCSKYSGLKDSNGRFTVTLLSTGRKFTKEEAERINSEFGGFFSVEEGEHIEY